MKTIDRLDVITEERDEDKRWTCFHCGYVTPLDLRYDKPEGITAETRAIFGVSS